MANFKLSKTQNFIAFFIFIVDAKYYSQHFRVATAAGIHPSIGVEFEQIDIRGIFRIENPEFHCVFNSVPFRGGFLTAAAILQAIVVVVFHRILMVL